MVTTPAGAEPPTPPRLDLLLEASFVLPMTPGAPVIADGAVGITGDRIAWVGPSSALPPATAVGRREVVRGGVICPGLINLHAHLAHSLLTAAGDGLSVSDWLERLIFPLERRAVDEAFVAVASELGVAQMLAAGVTCTVDMYYFEDAVARVVDRLGYRAVLGETVIGYPAPDAREPGGGLAHAERLLGDWAGHPRVTPAVAPHASYTTDTALLLSALALQERRGGPYLIHLSEARSEIATIAARHGASPIAYLDRIGVLQAPVVGAHVIYPQPGDLEILARRRVAVAHCPQSNLHMGEAAAPIADYLAAGIAVGLGTDGSGSAPGVDLLGEAALCGRLMKMRAGRADAVSGRDLLHLLTAGAAAALRRDDLGVLLPGKRADVTVFEPAGPAPEQPMGDPFALLIYASAHRRVALTVVDGRVLYDRGAYPTLDHERLRAAVAVQGRRMRLALGRIAGRALDHLVRVFALAALAALGAACSYTFDDSTPEVALLGEAPRTAELPHLNRGPGESARIVRGVDGAPWVALRERGNLLRLLRLADPPAEEVVQALQVHFFYRSMYLLDPSMDPERRSLLRIRTPGAKKPDQEIQLPPGDPLLLVGGADDVFVYWIRSASTTTFDIIRRDGYQRSVPLPAGLDPEDPFAAGLLFFDGPGHLLFVRDGRARLRAYATASEEDRDLGQRPGSLVALDALRVLLACGDDGLVRLPMDAGEPLVLDEGACEAGSLRIAGKAAYYQVAGELRRVALDGSAPPERAFAAAAQQLLAAGPADELAYSLDPASRWANGASDGWIGGRRFMERGRMVTFRRAGGRVRWLEDAATLTGAGDLLAQDLSGPAPLHLARNVRGYNELGDGRLLCVANYAFRGGQNRIIVIDEATRTARWVADGASGFLLIPGTGDLLAQLPRDDRGFDLVRVSLPPR